MRHTANTRIGDVRIRDSMSEGEIIFLIQNGVTMSSQYGINLHQYTEYYVSGVPVSRGLYARFLTCFDRMTGISGIPGGAKMADAKKILSG